MSETLTYDPGTDTVTTENNLSTEEQDSLKVGQEIENQQEQLLAGKYKNAEELEQAYVELQKKLGDDSSGNEEPEASDEEVTDETEPNSTNILDDLWDQVEAKEFSEDTMKQLSSMKPSDIAKMHLEYRSQIQNSLPQEYTQEQVEGIKGIVGGEENYSSMMKWASDNLAPQEIDMFDQAMDTGNPMAAYFAVQALAYRYQDSQGQDGEMLTGKPPSNSGNTFKSQAQLVAAMSDPRYEKDPAYRKDVQDKLERSNINFDIS